MNGIHEVRGSIPLVSTSKINSLRQALCLLFAFRYQYVTKIRICIQIRYRTFNCRIGCVCITSRHSNIRVTQNAHQCERIRSGVRHPGCGGMPQIVETEIRDCRFPKGRPKTLLDVIKPRSGLRTRENVFALFLNSFKQITHGLVDRYEPLFARLTFCDLKNLPTEIDIEPFKVEYFPASQAGMAPEWHS